MVLPRVSSYRGLKVIDDSGKYQRVSVHLHRRSAALKLDEPYSLSLVKTR